METLTKTLVFSGIKHCGKTTLGKLIAATFGVPFADTDAELERAFRKDSGRVLTTREIFSELGDVNFRQFEAEIVSRMAAENNPLRVIALGGGVPSNRFLAPGVLKRLGFRIYLEIDPGIAYRRVVRGGIPPFLAGAANPEAEFLRLNQWREPFFRANADLVFPIHEEIACEEMAKRLIEAIGKELGL